MKIEHVALWVKDLEKSKAFYGTYFGAKAGNLYHNPQKEFRSYFLTFEDGARLELMNRTDVTDESSQSALGWAHLAFSVGSKERVDFLTKRLIQDGHTCQGMPRVTGDGYYESVFEDPEKNIIEITI